MALQGNTVQLSRVLTKEENATVAQAYGDKCKVQAAGVVQLFMTEPPHNNSWIKNTAGVVTLTKDETRKGFFIQVLDIEENFIVFEQEVYREFEYHSDVAFFHQFEGEDRMIGLNFADDIDASNFKFAVYKLLENRRKKRQQREARQKRLIEEENEKLQNELTFKRKEKEQQQIQQQQQQQQQQQEQRQTKEKRRIHTRIAFRRRDKQNEKKNYRNMKISEPYNFEHLGHGTIGDSVKPEQDLMDLFKLAGLGNKELQDEKKRQFIYSFLEEKGGGLEEARKMSRKYSQKQYQQQQQQEQDEKQQVTKQQPAYPLTTAPLAPPSIPGSRTRSISTSSSTSSLNSLSSTRHHSANTSYPPPPIPLRPSIEPLKPAPPAPHALPIRNGHLPPSPPPIKPSFSTHSTPVANDVGTFSIPPPPPPLVISNKGHSRSHSSTSTLPRKDPPPLPLTQKPQLSSTYKPPPPPVASNVPPPPPLQSNIPPPPGPPPPPVPSNIPPPPPLPSNLSPGPPPPPPPPLVVSGSSPSAPTTDLKGALMDQIRNSGTKTLKKATPTPPPLASSSTAAQEDPRDQLLKDIRTKGLKQLHHVEPQTEVEKTGELEGMALGLQRALQEIYQVVHSDSDTTTEDEYSDDDEWDD